MAERTPGTTQERTSQEPGKTAAADHASDMREQVRERGKQAQEVAEEMGAQVRDWAQEKGSQIKEGAQEALQQVGASASHLAEIGRTTVDQLEGSLEEESAASRCNLCSLPQGQACSLVYSGRDSPGARLWGNAAVFPKPAEVRTLFAAYSYLCWRRRSCKRASYSEVDGLPCLSTANHCFSPLHVMHTRFEGDYRVLLRPPNCVGELFLHAVISLRLRGVGDLTDWVSPRRPAKMVCFWST